MRCRRSSIIDTDCHYDVFFFGIVYFYHPLCNLSFYEGCFHVQ